MLPRSVCLVSIHLAFAHYNCGVVETSAQIGIGEGLTDKVTLRALNHRGWSQASSSITKSSEHSVDHPKKLTPEKRLKIKHNWDMNHEDLMLLDNKMQELSIMRLDLVKTLEASDEKPQQLSTALELLSVFHKNVGILKTNKFLELGEIDVTASKHKLTVLLTSHLKKDAEAKPNELPNDLLDLITKETWKRLGDSTVNQLVIKSRSNHQSFLSPSKKLGFQWWRYVFKSIDFFYENQFVNHDTVTNLFQEPNIFKNLMDYMRHCVAIDFKGPTYLRANFKKEYWYWQLLDESFQAFSKETKNMINTHYLLKDRYEREFRPYVSNDNLEWTQSNWWFNPKPFQEAWEEKKLPSSSDLNPMKASIHQMVKHVATANIQSQNPQDRELRRPMEFMFDFFEFLDQGHLLSDYVTDEFQSYPNYKELEKQMKLFKLSTTMYSLEKNLNQFFEYITERNPYSWQASSSYKSIYDSHLNQFTTLFNHYQSEVKQLTQPSIHFISVVQTVIEDFKKVSNELTDRSNRFSVN